MRWLLVPAVYHAPATGQAISGRHLSLQISADVARGAAHEFQNDDLVAQTPGQLTSPDAHQRRLA